jgi:hypothetical protein
MVTGSVTASSRVTQSSPSPVSIRMPLGTGHTMAAEPNRLQYGVLIVQVTPAS